MRYVNDVHCLLCGNAWGMCGKWGGECGIIISIPAALMWWGTPLIVGGLILYDTIQEKNPELCGFTAEEFDKEENK